MPIADKDIPELARRCWDEYQSATTHLRDASKESRRMWVGGKYQWRDDEVAARIGANRPFLTINRCRPAVSQVENEARNNPPGPQASPVGGGADADGADTIEGLIREYEYRSDAHRAYVTALRNAAAGNAGVFEMATEYAGERTMDQRIVIKEIEDPDMVFVDPNARMACREDAMYAGKIRVLSKDQVIEQYGKDLKILNRNFIERSAGWMQSAVGWRGGLGTINTWTGGAGSVDGPYYICEFYRVAIDRVKLTEYQNGLLLFDGEPTNGAAPKLDDDGEPISRLVPRRTVKKYTVTAMDVIGQAEWTGDIPPFFWVLGPEMYVDGKLFRLSLIDGAMDSQRALNYMATAVTEVVGTMNKSSGFLGYQGQFDTANAQGINPWDDFNMKLYSRMEIKPTWAINPVSGQAELLPPPQRSAWEAPIARLLEAATFFGEQIKAATSVFFDPTVQSARDAQSGEAIKALQSQTNIGTLNWQDNLHRAVSLSYQQAWLVLRKIYSSSQARTIVRADSEHEIRYINATFQSGDDTAAGKSKKTYNITQGEYAFRVLAGANDETRSKQALERFMELLRIAPQVTQAPGVLAQVVRMVGDGNPLMEQMADSLMPNDGEDLTPEQLKQKIMGLQQSDQQKTALIQQLSQALLAKLPEIQSRERIAMMNMLGGIRKAEITASKDLDKSAADRDASMLEAQMGMAHEAATQAVDHEHETGMQEQQNAAAVQQQQMAQEAQQQQGAE